MPRLLLTSLLALLWTGSASAAGALEPARLMQVQAPLPAQPPHWPSNGSQRHLPAAGFSAAEDRTEEDDLSAGEAARQAQQLNGGGRVLSVEQAHDGWRVKLIKNGDVRIVFVPD
ncbi:hypothetical protein ED208_10525 [Stagnimonas aquatica]|uniref:Uncharacterized protein n=1 Tax=Stagnimonas aquatica TaxID=2689987 RepID=A0A3N0VA14_9GAMM|nr:hypothetical protein [Stagnimonas aquatica]ROH89555.1 hypothetical protein ED208_10525 [Stagnimonas aquatica]